MEVNSSSTVDPKLRLKWGLALFHLTLHVALIVAPYYLLTGRVKVLTILFVTLVFVFAGIGTAIGAHRFFAHRSFKATRGFKIFLLACETLLGDCSAFKWARIHRLHHKFVDTDGDPTNINRGIFFSYIGHFIYTFHPDCQKEWDRIDMTDLASDPDIMFQHRNFSILFPVFGLFLPSIIPHLFWGESLWIATWLNLCRCNLNLSHLNLSSIFSHSIGSKPYDTKVSATQNRMLGYWTFGDGFHNFHHTFPTDYKGFSGPESASFNVWVKFLHAFEKRGWVSDLKKASPETIAKRAKRTGDGSFKLENFETGRIANEILL